MLHETDSLGSRRRGVRMIQLTALCIVLQLGGLVMAAQPLQLDPLQLEAAIGWDDNLTRSSNAPSRLGDRMHTVSVSRRATVPLAEHVQCVADGFLSAEKLARYEGLDRLAGGVTGQLQYRRSAAFGAPTFSLLAGWQRDQYRSHQRTGSRFALGATARQSWTDRIDAYAALGWSRRDAADAVFDQRERGVRAHIDYSAGTRGTIYAGAEHRRGDIITTSFGIEPEYANAARADAPDTAFGPGYHAYRLGGRTTIWTLGWSLPLNNKQALDFSRRQVLSSASIPAETVRYRSTLYSLSYLLQF
jgi:hypothetical protein